MRPKQTSSSLPVITIPSEEKWEALIEYASLTPRAARMLQQVLLDVREQIIRYNQTRASRPDRNTIVRRMKEFEKALAKIESFTSTHSGILADAFPTECLWNIGLLFSDEALSSFLGKKQLYGRRTKKRPAAGLPDYKKRTLGLTHGPQLIQHFIRTLRKPLTDFLEIERRENRGGRPQQAVRDLLITELANNSEEIFGIVLSSHAPKRFLDLGEIIIKMCGLSMHGAKPAIARNVARRYRTLKRAGIGQKHS